MSPEELITNLRSSDEYIEVIFMNGGCYKFYKFLKSIFPYADPYIEKFHKGHITTMIDGEMYDITGRIEYWRHEGYIPLIEPDLSEAKKWSFHKHNRLKVAECPNCDEPIVV